MAGVAAWDELRGDGPKPLASGARVDGRLQVEDAGKDAGDIGFDDRDRLVEGECGDGVRCVTANSRKFPDRFRVSRKSATMFFHYRDGSGPEISGSVVVAEPLPGVKDVIFGSGGEGGEIGEAAEPLIIISDDGSYLGLLEHELGDEDGVGIGAMAPGKIAEIFAVPGKERAPE